MTSATSSCCARTRVSANGEPVTAEDVKFSSERYRGAAQSLIKERVEAIEASDPQHVRFKLKKPWPDFLTFYSSASGAGWIVHKKYVEKIGELTPRQYEDITIKGT